MVVTHTIEYLRECLSSIAHQTVEPSKVVVVDNGSPLSENIADLVRQFQYGYVRVDVGHSPATARNVGCEILWNCEFIANLDGDDVWEPRYLEVYLQQLLLKKAAVAYGPALKFGLENRVEFLSEGSKAKKDLRRGPFIPANSLFRTAVWRAVGGFDSEVGLYADYDFWMNVARAGSRFVYINEVLWRYRRHLGSESSTRSNDAPSQSRSLIRQKHRRFINGTLQWRRVFRKSKKVLFEVPTRR